MNGPSNPWREPMVWLVFGIPAVTLLAAIVLVVILARTDGGSDVTDTVRGTSSALPPP